MSLLRSALVVGAAAALSRILGFVRDVLFASALGAGPVADAFLAVFRLPNLARRTLSEGGLNAGVVPLHAQVSTEAGAQAARGFAAQAVRATTLAALGLVAAVEVGAGALVLVLASGYADDPAVFDLATLYTRLMAPFLGATLLASLLGALLNAERKFAATAFAPLAVNAVLVLALLGLRRWPETSQATQAAWLAAATSASGLLHLALVSLAMRGRMAWSSPGSWPNPCGWPNPGGGPGPEGWRPRVSPSMRRLAAAAGPALVASGAAQLMILAGTAVASFTPSALSWLYYADRVFQLPLGFVGSAVGVVLLPEMAARHAAGDPTASVAAQNRALEAALLLSLPAATALALLSPSLASVLFQRDAFGPQDSAGVALALSGLALGLPCAAVAKVLAQTLFARGAMRSAVMGALAGIVAAAAAAVALAGPLGVFGIGLGISLGLLAHAAALGLALRRLSLWQADRRLWSRGGRIALATLVMALALAASSEKGVAAPPAPLHDALRLAALCLGGLGVYGLAAWGLGALRPGELAALSEKR